MTTNDVDMDIEEEKIEIEDDTPAPKQENPKKERSTKGRVRKKGGWLGKIIALFLGIIIGIGGGLGGVGGLAYYFATKKTIRQTSDFVTSISGFDVPLSEFLTDDYADKMLLNAVKDAYGVILNVTNGTGTFDDLCKISPKAESLITGKTGIISIFADFGITLDAETLKAKKILKPNTVTGEDTSYFTDYLRAELKNAPAGDFLKANNFAGNKLIDALVYGEKGEDYDVVDGAKVMKEGKAQLTIGGLLGENLMTRLKATPIDNIMDIKQTDTMMCEIAYGPKHRYVYNEEQGLVEMQQMFYTFDGTKFFDDEKKEVATTAIEQKENGDYVLTFADESTQLVKFENEKYMVYTNEETPQPIKYKKTVYGDMEGSMLSVIDRVSLPTVLGVTKGDGKSHAIMEAIAFDNEGNPRTLGQFKADNQNIINGIKLSTVLPVNTSSNVIMYMLYGRKNVHYYIDTENGNAVKPMQQRVAVLGDKVFNAYGELIEGAVANGTMEYTLNEVTYRLTEATVDDIPLTPINVKWTEKQSANLYNVSLEGTPLTDPVAVYETKVFDKTGKLIENAVANAEKTEYTLKGKTYTLTPSSAEPMQVTWTEKQSAQTYYVWLDEEKLMYQESTIGTLKDSDLVGKVTDRMQLQEFVDVSGNRILKNVADKTITEIPTAVNNMTIEDVFGDTFYYRVTDGTLDAQGYPVITSFRVNEQHQFIDNDGNVMTGYYLCYMDGTKIDLNSDDNVQTREELDLALTGSWKYILRSKDEHGNYYISHSATLTDLDGIMNNMMHNIHDASVRELEMDGMVSGLDNTTMNKPLMDTIPTVKVVGGVPTLENVKIKIGDYAPSMLDGDGSDTDTVGDLTIEQLLKYTAAILNVFTTP